MTHAARSVGWLDGRGEDLVLAALFALVGLVGLALGLGARGNPVEAGMGALLVVAAAASLRDLAHARSAAAPNATVENWREPVDRVASKPATLAMIPIPIRPEPTDLAALLRASLKPLEAQAAREGVELRVVTMGDVPSVAVDREKLGWCIATLAGNSLRYVKKATPSDPRGGSVLVHLSREGSGAVAIAVQDDGPGIPEDKLPFLFERREGALYAEGLTLSLVRDVVAAHRATIDVESRQGAEEHGTSITIRLPAP